MRLDATRAVSSGTQLYTVQWLWHLILTAISVCRLLRDQQDSCERVVSHCQMLHTARLLFVRYPYCTQLLYRDFSSAAASQAGAAIGVTALHLHKKEKVR
jgi:hypothetical protein